MDNKNDSTKNYLLIIICFLLSSCFGPRLNKHNTQSGNKINTTLASAHDDNIQVDLNYLLVRNSPRSWVKDAKWDEYIFSISSLTDDVLIEKITIVDSLDYESTPKLSRSQLIKATKKSKRRFKKAGIKIKLGNGSTHMLTKSITGTVVGAGIGAGVASTGGVTMAAGTLTTAGGAVFVAVPAALVGGVLKVVNNTKVNNKIQARQTTLPKSITGHSLQKIDLFYSAIPSPQLIKINYSINDHSHLLELELPDNFTGLHYK